MNGYVPDLVRSDSDVADVAIAVGPRAQKLRAQPRFKVRFDVAFQSSCANTAELFCRYLWL